MCFILWNLYIETVYHFTRVTTRGRLVEIRSSTWTFFEYNGFMIARIFRNFVLSFCMKSFAHVLYLNVRHDQQAWKQNNLENEANIPSSCYVHVVLVSLVANFQNSIDTKLSSAFFLVVFEYFVLYFYIW